MGVKERIRVIRIIEKIKRNKEFSRRIGIRSVATYRKERERNEVHRR